MFCYLKISCLPADKTAQNVSQLNRKSLSQSAREKYTAQFTIVKAMIDAMAANCFYLKYKPGSNPLAQKSNCLQSNRVIHHNKPDHVGFQEPKGFWNQSTFG